MILKTCLHKVLMIFLNKTDAMSKLDCKLELRPLHYFCQPNNLVLHT